MWHTSLAALASLAILGCGGLGDGKDAGADDDDQRDDVADDIDAGEDDGAADDADAAPALDCVEGDAGRVEYGGHCYSRFSTSKNWVTAEADCVALGGHLASLTDADEVAAVDVIVGNVRVWIGINDRTTENAFVWSSGEPVAFTDWDDDQPDNGSGSEDCALIRGNDSRRWDDDQCDNSHPYVCERG
jgi:hypothetical protein